MTTDTGSGSIGPAVAALGAGPFDEAALQRHVAPLFARMRAASPDRIYLANHSLGRPPDAMEDDVREGLAAWYAQMGGAWDAWLAECDAYRARLATLIGAARPDTVVPKTSAGQGLRAILNTYDDVPRVVATRGEFDSLDVILREYARRGRIALDFVEPHEDGRFAEEAIVARVRAGCDLLVVSEVIFNTGQRLMGLPSLVEAAHAAGTRVLVDVYHAVGVFPVDVTATDADFAVGGSYKYLRGGPGAAFLYVHPRHLDGRLRTLDIGWFAKRDRFAYQRPEPPLLEPGGDAFLESTPPVLTYYQARAGQVLLQALGAQRLRAYSVDQLRHLVDALRGAGFDTRGGTDDQGAFATVRHDGAEALASALREAGIVVDARGPWLRLCPDVVTTRAELDIAVERLARCAAARERG
jgi:kynureninase